jgi:acetoacetate decarboxylase
MTDAPQMNAGDISFWPILKIDYPTDAAKIAALLPPGIDASDSANVHLSIYCVPVPDEPEYGCVVSVDADYRGQKGVYTLGYGIDQESAVFISRDMNGQPKYPAEIDFFLMGDNVNARVCHQNYTFIEYAGQKTTVAESAEWTEYEWWVKNSRAVGGAEKAYDFPPHVVQVKSVYQPVHVVNLEGDLLLRESPWDPIAESLPVKGAVSARLQQAIPTTREITLEGPLDPDAYWPFSDTISGSRWPGQHGGPKRTR